MQYTPATMHAIINDLYVQAYQRGFRYPAHFFLTLMYPWYVTKEWWLVPDPQHSCTPEQRNSVVPYIMGPVDYDLITNHSVVADTGIVSLPTL